MKTISLISAMEILQNCKAVIVNEEAVCFPSLYKESEDFLVLCWYDEYCGPISLTLKQANNKEVKIELREMFLTNEKGEEVRLEVLFGKNIEFNPDFQPIGLNVRYD